MCGRFTLHTPEEEILETFGLESAGDVDLGPHFNIAPSRDIPVIRESAAGRVITPARWGLVPHWSKEPKTKYSTINARIETVAEKPAYRTSFRRKRCLIPADGYYEWKIIGERKIPHYMYLPGNRVFAFAGLWDRWEQNGDQLDSCTIIVMPSKAAVHAVHDRMPAILDPADYAHWIDPGLTEPDSIMQLLASRPSRQLAYRQVSTHVNSPRNDDVRCIEALHT